MSTFREQILSTLSKSMPLTAQELDRALHSALSNPLAVTWSRGDLQTELDMLVADDAIATGKHGNTAYYWLANAQPPTLSDPRETALLDDWISYTDDSLRAIAFFKVKLELWAKNGNRQRQDGDFQAAYKAVSDVVGRAWSDRDGLDELVAVVTGEDEKDRAGDLAGKADRAKE